MWLQLPAAQHALLGSLWFGCPWFDSVAYLTFIFPQPTWVLLSQASCLWICGTLSGSWMSWQEQGQCFLWNPEMLNDVDQIVILSSLTLAGFFWAMFMPSLCFFCRTEKNGGEDQRPGRCGHHWSRGGLPQHDCLQKSKTDCLCATVCCQYEGKNIHREVMTHRWALGCPLVCISVPQQHMSGSLSLETNPILFLSTHPFRTLFL